jgi:hypothetical protein
MPEDHPALRADAAALAAAVPGARLTTVPGLAHPLAERPGDRPAPPTPEARTVDDAVTAWFATRLAT